MIVISSGTGQAQEPGKLGATNSQVSDVGPKCLCPSPGPGLRNLSTAWKGVPPVISCTVRRCRLVLPPGSCQSEARHRK
jgi:hypothetical protein